MEEEKLFAFVMMPFDRSFDDIYKFGIKEPANQLGFHAERVDEQIYSEGILDRIYRQIELADVIIADMSGKNPNVFYEVGYAHAKDKICILLTSNAEDIPFDLAHKRHVIYNNSIKMLQSEIIENLQWAKNEIQNIKNSNIHVTIKSISGELEKTKYSAMADIEFKIDLLNSSKSSSPDIEAIYFYSGDGWTLYQDGKECPQTDSDISTYKKKHFLSSPVQRLRKDQWAQLVYKGKKTLAWSFKGEELKDKYSISGRSNLRITTSKGNFDYELRVDTEVDEIPF